MPVIIQRIACEKNTNLSERRIHYYLVENISNYFLQAPKMTKNSLFISDIHFLDGIPSVRACRALKYGFFKEKSGITAATDNEEEVRVSNRERKVKMITHVCPFHSLC